MKYIIIEGGKQIDRTPVSNDDANGIPYVKVRAFTGDLVVDKFIVLDQLKTIEQQTAEIITAELDGLDQKNAEAKEWGLVDTPTKEANLIEKGIGIEPVAINADLEVTP